MLSGLIHVSQSYSKWIPEKSNDFSGALGHILQYNSSVLLSQNSFLGKTGILFLGNKIETKTRKQRNTTIKILSLKIFLPCCLINTNF